MQQVDGKDSFMSKNLEVQLPHYDRFLFVLAPGFIKRQHDQLGSRPILWWKVEKQHWFWNMIISFASNSRFHSFLSHSVKCNGSYQRTIKMGNAMFYFQSPIKVLKIKQTRNALSFLILTKLQSKYEHWASMQMFLPCEGFLEIQRQT